MATATSTAGGSSNDNNGAAPEVKSRGAEVTGVDGNNEDCGADAGSLSAAVVRLQWQRKQQSTKSRNGSCSDGDGGISNDNDGTVPDAKGGLAEVIGVDGGNEDCGADARSLLVAVMRLRQQWKQ